MRKVGLGNQGAIVGQDRRHRYIRGFVLRTGFGAAVMFHGAVATAQKGGASADSAAPPNDEIPFAPLAGESRYSIGWPHGAKHEGDIAVPIHMWSRTSKIKNLGDAGPSVRLRDCMDVRRRVGGLVPEIGKSHVVASGCTVSFLPHFTVRQQKGGSAPVLAPTFNPGIEFNIYVLGLDKDRTGKRWLLDREARAVLSDLAPLGMSPGTGNTTGTLGAFQLRIAHYSNGQSGCQYNDQEYDARTQACIPVSGMARSLNTRDGSFSTNYIEFASSATAVVFTNGLERKTASLGYSIRSYPGGFFSGGGGMSSELAKAYGRWEFGGNSSLRWRPSGSDGPWRVVRTLKSEGVCAYKRARSYGKCRGSLEGMLSWPSLYGLGISARYVAGWDQYNIAFATQARNPQSHFPIISLVFDHSRAITITRSARETDAR